jgi:molybdenum cofactor guanylyltransferase
LSLPPSVCEAADAFVLAGGKSRRMGSDKALLEINGVPLIEHALAILRRAELDPRIAGARSDLSRSAPVIADDAATSGLGPLSGICTALSATDAAYAVFLPVDVPLVPRDLIVYLLRHAAITQSAVTLPSVAGFIQTFPVVIDRAAAPALERALGSDDRNCLKAFRAAANALSKPFSALPIEVLIQAGQVSDPAGLPAYAWFYNINSPPELEVVAAVFSGSPARQLR